MTEDRREFTRVPIRIHAEITFADRAKILGDSFDLSLKGLSMEGGETALVGKECSIRISLNAPPEQMEIRSAGVVVQYENGRMGVLFHHVEMESFEHLRNLILYNAQDETQVEEEFQHHLGLKKTTE